MSKFKKILLVILIFFGLVCSNLAVPLGYTKAQPVFRQEVWYNPSLSNFYLKVYGKDSPTNDIFGERYAAAQVNWIIWSLLTFVPTQIVGPGVMSCSFDMLPPPLGRGNTNPDAVLKCLRALGLAANEQKDSPSLGQRDNRSFLAVIFQDRPLSFVTYVKDIGRKFKLVPEANAQTEGFGFTTALSPILPFWKATRNISYAIFVVISIAFSFMIMFRVKVSPQVVISIQSAIPKIAISLVLITFSYAIAGLMVDLMYLSIGVISGIFASLFGGGATQIFNLLTNGNSTGTSQAMGAFQLTVSYIALFSLGALFVLFSTLGGYITTIAAALVIAATIITSGGFAVVAILLIATIIIAYAAFVSFKILWLLFKTYAYVILLTIFSPLMIVLGLVIPSFGFSAWLKMLISNLAVFVATGTMFLLSYVFLYSALALTPIGGLWDFTKLFGVKLFRVSSASSTSWPPLLGTGGTESVAFLFLGVSFVIFSSIPKVNEVIQSLLQGKPFAYGAAIGEQVVAPINLGRAQLGRYATNREKNLGYTEGWMSFLRTLGAIKK
ncbi:hypothetical protein HY045_01260 [Candidatus Woesebacteria bacterium]|nr:hypothetical protein [Candidatus Woesebacteria bacterium]